MVARGQARPTLRDVAERAGVSVSTASLVFSGKGPVAEATGDRVRAAAAELGFTGPNPLASSLRHGRSGAIGVLVEGRLRMAFRDPFVIAVLDGLAEVLETVPTGMLLIGQPTDSGDSVVPQLAPLALDAVVFSLCGPGENPAVEHLAARGALVDAYLGDAAVARDAGAEHRDAAGREVLETVPTGMLLIGQPTDSGDSVVPQLAPLALDAVVFSLCGPGENPAVEHLAARGIPMFSTGVPGDRRITQVRVDERAAGAAIAEHVRTLGHRRVAHVAMPMLPTSAAGPVPDAEVQLDEANVPSVGRLLGFRDVFGPGAPAVQTGDGSSFEGGTIAGRALLDVPERQRPTAIVAQSDVIAAGVIAAAEELGLRVPEDLSVTGFDGVDLPWLPHRITTMDQRGREKGRLLGTLVRRRLDGEHPRSVTQPVLLRVGTTTAPPR